MPAVQLAREAAGAGGTLPPWTGTDIILTTVRPGSTILQLRINGGAAPARGLLAVLEIWTGDLFGTLWSPFGVRRINNLQVALVPGAGGLIRISGLGGVFEVGTNYNVDVSLLVSAEPP